LKKEVLLFQANVKLVYNFLMRTTPFDVPPLSKFLYRLVGPTVAWLLLCWSITGLVYPSFWLAKPSQISAIAFDPDGWIQLYHDLAANLTTPPGICKSGQELRDVENDLCQDFKVLLQEREIMALTPWGILFIFLFLNILIFQSYYQSVAAQIRQGKVKYVGQVLGRSRSTFFSRFFFLRSVDALLPGKIRVTAYLGQELEPTKKGQSILVYETWSIFSGKRYLAVLDNPHIAIFYGS
jgi:hypothetical protein